MWLGNAKEHFSAHERAPGLPALTTLALTGFAPRPSPSPTKII